MGLARLGEDGAGWAGQGRGPRGRVNGRRDLALRASSSRKGEAEEASRAAVAGSRAPASGAKGRRGPGRPDLAGNGLGRGSGSSGSGSLTEKGNETEM